MPIRPENRHRYADNWGEVRAAILRRAGLRCEGSPAYPDCRRWQYSVTDEGSRVVLTVAHLDHQPENNDPENLRAWCQRCHLTYDAGHHADTARRTRTAGQSELEL